MSKFLSMDNIQAHNFGTQGWSTTASNLRKGTAGKQHYDEAIKSSWNADAGNKVAFGLGS